MERRPRQAISPVDALEGADTAHIAELLAQHSDRDQIFQEDALGSFAFGESVARVFGDMASRSIPGYATLVEQVGVIAQEYARPGTRVYDLGASLGACSLAMASRIEDPSVSLHAVDNSPSMVRRLRSTLKSSRRSVEIEEADIEDAPIHNTSVVAMNFTLQFISPHKRRALLEKIYRGLVPGGVLILSEKVRFDTGHRQERNTRLHHAFKRSRGYSELEVARKREALEGYMQVDTLPIHLRRLHSIGFVPVEPWFRCYGFVSLVAYRS